MSEGVTQSVSEEPSSSTEPPLSSDQLFELLGNDRRRCIIRVILDSGDELTLDDLVTKVAELEHEKSANELTSAERKRVYTALQQTHIPKLEEKGVIEFNPETGIIEPAKVLTDLDVYLQVVGRRTLPYSIYYLLLSATGLVILGGNRLGVGPLTQFSATTWASFIVAAFGLTASIHLFHIRRMRLDPGKLIQEVDADGTSLSGQGAFGRSSFQHRSIPIALGSGVIAGVVAGIGMGMIFHYVMFMMPLAGSVYGLEFVRGGWIAHLANSIGFGILFAAVISKTRLQWYAASFAETTTLGALYGLFLWVVVEGAILPMLAGPAVSSTHGPLYLPVDGLTAHLIYGISLGALYGGITRFLSKRD